ncbi:MAG: PhoU domain-containing protein [Myxococcota bacterium]|jgi:hypothetical protein|nr:PhoU domain-containing protein [Myxococcota bacterium]
MFEWLKSLGQQDEGLEQIQNEFLQMLEDGRHIFDASSNALLGGTNPSVIHDDLFDTDKRINKTEQLIRRQMVVHGSIHGSQTFPALLVFMSLTKDAERIGDFAKNLYELASWGPYLGNQETKNEMATLKNRISKLLIKARHLYEEQDTQGARAFLNEVDEHKRLCDQKVQEFMGIKDENMSGCVLTYRFYKRILSHLSNIISSVIMPVDKLGYRPEKSA